MSIKQLYKACEKGDNLTVQSIMAGGGVDVNSLYRSCTPLYIAMCYNHPSVVTSLLSSADTRLDATIDSFGWTGLHGACLRNNHNASVISVVGRDDRCIPAILNMKDKQGSTAVMLATQHGHLEGVKEMAKLPGTDFGTKNAKGQTLLDVAREMNHTQIVQFLEERSEEERLNTQGKRSTAQLATDVAENTLGSLRLKEIAEELENIEAIEAVLESENSSLEIKHKEEIDSLEDSHKQEFASLLKKQEDEKEEHQNMSLTNLQRKTELERTLHARLTPSAPSTSSTPSPDVPECPVCMEEMKPPMQIFNCPNGHLVCAVCKPKMKICTNCRMEYGGRATAVEQMLRQMFNCQ